MIKVIFQPEPHDFKNKVENPGNQWLNKHPDKPSTKARPYWRRCLPDLHRLYNGICAYHAWFIEYGNAGDWSVDHFIPKELSRDRIYTWSNYRFCRLNANSAKGIKTIMDPFDVKDDLFVLNLSTGEISVNTDSQFNTDNKQLAETTISELNLNDESLKKRRAKDYSNCIQNKINIEYLKEINPFVWYEANRQGLL